MLKAIPKLFVLASTFVTIAAGLATTAKAQTWTESYYTFTETDNQVDTYNSFVASFQDLSWTVTVADHFVVTGSSDNTPAWRLLFASIASNYWSVSANLSGDFSDSDYYVTNCENYDTQTGTESFTDGLGDTDSRSLNDKTTNSLYYTFFNMDDGGGAGGGS